jgi:uncharacterized protein (TIGR00251 family)
VPPPSAWYRYDPQRDVLTLALRIQPNAGSTAFAGLHDGCLKVRVAAPALEGRANAALLDFLRRTFELPGGRVMITRGEHGRTKTIEIPRPGPALLMRVRAWQP